MKFLSGVDFWQTIENLSKESNQIKVAVAYLGKKALDFNWKEGDILIVAYDKKNILDGAIDIDVLETLINKKVQVFSCKDLHAKIYHFGNSAVIGSANLSVNSKKLLEAAILTSNKPFLDDITTYINDLIEISSVINCNDLPKLWFLKTHDLAPDANRSQRLEEQKKVFNERQDSKNYTLTDIKINDPILENIQSGDIIITLHDDKDLGLPRFCYRYSSNDKLLYLKTPNHMTLLNWSNVKSNFAATLNTNQTNLENRMGVIHTFNSIYKSR